MVEGRRLSSKPLQPLAVVGEGLGQEFEGNEAVQAGVLSLVNHTHPATTELLDDAVMRDGLPDREIGQP